MKTKYNVKFQLEQRKDKSTGKVGINNVPIYLEVTFLNTRFRYFTGFRVESKDWEKEKELVKRNTINQAGVTSTDINTQISKLRTAVDEIFSKNDALEIVTTHDLLRDYLNESQKKVKSTGKEKFWAKYEEYIQTAKVTDDRKRQLKSTMQHLKRFEEARVTPLTFETFTVKTLQDFEDYLKKDALDPKQYSHMKGNQKPRPKGSNTIAAILKKTRAFFRWAEKNHIVRQTPFKDFSFAGEIYSSPLYLTKEERDYLFHKEITIEKLSRVRDIFVFQCLVGCRVGDLVKLTRDNIINGCLEYIPRKTKDDRPVAVRVPLSDKAMALLNKYNLPDGKLFPFISDQRYNAYIKELFIHVELTRIVTRLNPLTRKEEQVPLDKVATSHMARRTFIGTLHKRNVKNEVIASMSGHTKDSRAFSRYYDVDDEQRQDAVNKYLD